MLYKTQKIYKRYRKGHSEKVLKTTWWLFRIIPVYVNESVLSYTL